MVIEAHDYFGIAVVESDGMDLHEYLSWPCCWNWRHVELQIWNPILGGLELLHCCSGHCGREGRVTATRKIEYIEERNER